MKTLVVLLALGPFSSCEDFRELLVGTKPIEDKPVVLDSAPAASALAAAAPAEPDPRLAIKLPNGGEASYEYAEARRLMTRGQLSAASFVLTPKAMGPTGTADELDLLAELCQKRDDRACVVEAAAHRKGLGDVAGASIDDLKKLAKKSPADARALLMQRLEVGTITADQVAVLGDACHTLRDKACESMVKAWTAP